MEGMSGPQDSGAWRFRRLALAAALIVCGLRRRPAQPGAGSQFAWSSRDRAGRRQPRHGAPASGTAPAGCTGRRRRAWTLWTSQRLFCGAVQPAAASPRRRRAQTRTAPRATSPWPSACSSAVAGLATFPLARRRGTDLDPDGAGRHRAGRVEPVRRQRHCCSRGSSTTRTAAAPSASSCRSSTWSSRPSRPCCSSAARPPTGPRSGWPPSVSSATPAPTSSYAVRFSTGRLHTPSARSPTSAGSPDTR